MVYQVGSWGLGVWENGVDFDRGGIGSTSAHGQLRLHGGEGLDEI